MISAVPDKPAAALLARERQIRHGGSGIQIEALPGCWMLQQTWSRSGDAPAPGTARLLRWLQASLILKRCDQELTIINQVCLAGFKLQFSGSANLKGSRPLLVFSFASLELSYSDLVLHRRSLPQPQRLPFFALIELNEEQGTLTARGRGGGLAQWSRIKQDSS